MVGLGKLPCTVGSADGATSARGSPDHCRRSGLALRALQLAAVVYFKRFRVELEAALDRSDRSKGCRPPYDAVLMFKILVLRALDTLSDDKIEYQLENRLSFIRFVGPAVEDRIPDAKTTWLFRGHLIRAGTVADLFARSDATLRDAGSSHHGRVDRGRGRDRGAPAKAHERDKATVKGGGVPEDWPKAKRRRSTPTAAGPSSAGAGALPEGAPKAHIAAEVAVPVFGNKNHLGIDRRHGFIRRHYRGARRAPARPAAPPRCCAPFRCLRSMPAILLSSLQRRKLALVRPANGECRVRRVIVGSAEDDISSREQG
jgi:IS5 family transposase